jgi:hypothetical protein
MTLSHARVTTVDMEQQSILNIMRVCPYFSLAIWYANHIFPLSHYTATSWQPRTALEPTKPMTHSFYKTQLWFEETRTVCVVQRPRARERRRNRVGDGWRERKRVLSGRASDALDGERATARVVRGACVRCVIVIGRRRKGGEIQ